MNPMDQITRLSRDEFWHQAGHSFRKVFLEGAGMLDVFPGGISVTDAMFTSHLDTRRMLPVHAFGIPDDWLTGIASGMKIWGERGFYLGGFGRSPGEPPPFWYVPIDQIHEIYVGWGHKGYVLDGLPKSFEHFLLSVNGDWATYLTFDFEFMAGTRKFIDVVDQFVPSQKEVLAKFLEYWEDSGNTGSNVEWISPMFTHLYGKDEAQRIIETMIHTEAIKQRMLGAL